MRQRSVLIALGMLLTLLLFGVFAVTSPNVQAQSSEGLEIAQESTLVDPNAVISWPLPVYVLRNAVEIRGTANLPGMTNYFIEFRELADDLSQIEDGDWIPATLPTTTPVIDGILGIWNTRTTEDGVYELRLTINAAGRPATFFVVSPIRVENEPPDFVVLETPTPQSNVPQPTNTLGVITRPTLPPTPTAFSGRPTITANTDANVRQGDSVAYPVVGSLLAGQSAELLGISSTGTGWYYILLENGRRGFIAPSLVRVTGDTSDLQRIQPPATPTPTFTPTPPFTGNLLMDGHRLEEAEPRCNVAFQAFVNVTNAGAQRTSGAVVIRLEDRDIASGTLTTVQEKTVPPLEPRENFVVVFDLRIDQFPAADHRITVTVDALNQVVEENENDNQRVFTYRLRRANCP